MYKPGGDVLIGKDEDKDEDKEGVKKEEYGKKYHIFHLKLDVPTGKLSDIVRVIPLKKHVQNGGCEGRNIGGKWRNVCV